MSNKRKADFEIYEKIYNKYGCQNCKTFQTSQYILCIDCELPICIICVEKANPPKSMCNSCKFWNIQKEELKILRENKFRDKIKQTIKDFKNL